MIYKLVQYILCTVLSVFELIVNNMREPEITTNKTPLLNEI